MSIIYAHHRPLLNRREQQPVQRVCATWCSRRLCDLRIWRRRRLGQQKQRMYHVRAHLPVRLPLVSPLACSPYPHSTHPSVTSVGATTLLPNEQAAAFSSGGFSNYWPQPSYQSAAVSAFLTQLGGNSSGLYNASGRAFPDVAAYGTLYDIYNSRAALEVSGTSAAVPTVASIVALLNDRLLTAGRATLGWLNPWLYGAASGAFASVTAGNNLACSGGTTGFYATSGWDPVRCSLCAGLVHVVAE